MATGKSGYFDVSNGGFTLRINWSETYDITANTSVVTITSADLMSTAYSGYSYFPHHYIKVNGQEVATFNSTLGTHSYYISAKNTFYGINAASGSPPPWTSSAIAHNADGTKSITIEVYINLWRTSSGAGNGTNLSGSQTIALTTIPRVSKPTLSASSVEFGKSITIYTNRNSTSFSHHLYYSINNGSETGIAADIGDSYTWTIPSSLMNNIPNATSAVIKFRLYTFSGSTNIGNNTVSFTATVPASVKPSVSISVSDAMGYASTYGGYIKSMSKFKIALSPTTAYGSAIASYSISANGSNYTSSSVTTDVIKSSGTLTISASVTDNRGRSGSASVSVTVLDYSAPRISLLKVNRCNSDGSSNEQGEYVKVTYSGSISSLNNKNTSAYTLSYRKSTVTDWTHVYDVSGDGTFSISNATYIFAADTGSSYNVKLVLSDYLQSTDSETVASTAFTMMHFNAAGNAMAIGKVAELDHTLDVGLDMRCNSDVYGMAGGLGYVKDIPSNSDLNNYTTPGWYCVPGNSTASTILNIPSHVAGKLKVSTGTGQTAHSVHTSNYAYVLQTYYAYQGNAIYTRYCSVNGTAGNWTYSDWRKIIIDINNAFTSFSKGIQGGTHTQIWTDGEGGNFALWSPNNVEWQMDAHDNNLRFYTFGTDGAYRNPFNLTPDGGVCANGALYCYSDVWIKNNWMTDFVVAQGTSGIWYYRKWNSGTAECWCDNYGDIQWGATAEGMSYNYFSMALPFKFSYLKMCMVNVMKGNYLSFATANTDSGYNKDSVEVKIMQYANAGATPIRFAVYCFGSWK